MDIGSQDHSELNTHMQSRLNFQRVDLCSWCMAALEHFRAKALLTPNTAAHLGGFSFGWLLCRFEGLGNLQTERWNLKFNLFLRPSNYE